MTGPTVAAPRIAVVGIGNPMHGDDGLGPAVVSALAGSLPTGVEAWTTRTPLDLATDLEGHAIALIVDAAVGAGPPGTVHRLVFGRDTVPSDASVLSSHEAGLLAALALAERLGTLPTTTLVLGIEAADFSPGTPAARGLVTLGSRAVRDALVALAPTAG